MRQVSIPHTRTLTQFILGALDFADLPEDSIDAVVNVVTALDDANYNGAGTATVQQDDLDRTVGFIFEASRVAIENAAHQRMAMPELCEDDRRRIRLESPAEYLSYKRDWYEAEQACKKAFLFMTRFDSYRQALVTSWTARKEGFVQ